MATTVNTVTGEVSSDDLGPTLVHEHFFFGFPGYQGDHTLGPFDRDKIMLSHDTVNVWLGHPPILPDEVANILGNWHITHVFDSVVPTLKENGVTEERIGTILVDNPRRLFGG